MLLDNLYLWLDLFALSYPLAQSFEHRLQYYKKWYALFPAIFIVGLGFIIWDVAFTQAGVWGFNDRYLLGVKFLDLPIEEWLFFLLIPYACIFIYECTLYFIPKRIFKGIALPFTILYGSVVLVVGLMHWGHAYTSVTFLLSALVIAVFLLVKRPDFLDRFWLGYIFSLIPFLLVNGVLTGSWLEDPVVWYNDAENLGIRIATIPLDDTVYLFLLLFSITWIYEGLLKRFPMVKSFGQKSE
jgi:lycopene cyclase domain-containing protein